MSQGCALLILRSKGQGHGAWLFENGFRTITDSVINLWSWNFIHLLTMSQGCALLILRSKGQRSRSWRMVIWKWFPDDNWLCNQPMIMKLHTLTHHGVKDAPYWFWGQKVKGQGHGAWLFENGFRTITDSVINLWSWNFIHLLTMSQGCALLILRSKGQRSRSWRMVIWKWFPDDNWLCNQPMIMKTSYTYSPWVKDVPYWFWGQKVNGPSSWRMVIFWKWSTEIMVADLNLLGSVGDLYCFSNYFQYAFICCPYMLPLLFENGFRTITDSVINQWSWNFIHLLTMSQGCALLILRSKGQRSRSWRMVIFWKWFPDDNWLCNQPMIMKLHTLTHHESRMRPIDFAVKRSKVKVMAHGY